MAASNGKREALHSYDDAISARRKRIKNEVMTSDTEPDTDSRSDDIVKRGIKGASASKTRGEKSKESHPHVCHFAGCERQYTRAEHLHRHQLEHIRDSKYFRCDHIGCDFGAVRKDLLDRHLDRHNKEGSNLWRRDQKRKKNRQNQPLQAARSAASSVDVRHSSDDMDDSAIANEGRYETNGRRGRRRHLSQQQSPVSPTVPAPFVPDPTSMVSPVSPVGPPYATQPLGQAAAAMNGFANPAAVGVNAMSAAAFFPPSSGPAPAAFYPGPRTRGLSSSTMPAFTPSGLVDTSDQVMTGMTALDMDVPDSLFAGAIDASLGQQPMDMTMHYEPIDAHGLEAQSLWENPLWYDIGLTYVGESGTRSVADPEKARRQREIYGNLADIESAAIGDGQSEGSRHDEVQLPTPSRVPTPLVMSTGQHALSETKYRELLTLIERKFDDVPRPKKIMRREGERTFFNGVHKSFPHGQLMLDTARYLSHKHLNEYLAAYWREYASQIPIIHPSLEPNRAETEPLLLLSMMAVGAMSSNHAPDSEIASFIAWNVRTCVQNHSDIVCPTETWVLQALVLLEAFEKLLSTRLLHERSHQLHGLTIELARRSECFEGTDIIEVDTRDAATLEESWRRFIEVESRKRVAYTVFMTDIFHACMFSHKAMVKFQEVELALPCVDGLWECRDASSFLHVFESGENRVHGTKHIQTTPSFQAVLKRIAESSGVREIEEALYKADLQQNTFAYKAVLAGFVSVHREIDKLASRKNCQTVLRNLETWVKRSRAVGEQMEQLNELYSICALAQINTRSSVVYLQQIACPSRILGKQVTAIRRNEALKQIRRWVRNDLYVDTLFNASGSAYAAARYLTHIFASERDRAGRPTAMSVEQYNPCVDLHLHRPWAVYVAVLCIWAFAYTVEGPIKKEHIVLFRTSSRGSFGAESTLTPGSLLPLDREAVAAANKYLLRLVNIGSPRDALRDGELNRCLGLLAILADRFHACQWELLREAGDRLQDCARISRGETAPVDGWTWIPVYKATEEEKQEAELENKELAARIRKHMEDNDKHGKKWLAKLDQQKQGKASQDSRASSQGVFKREDGQYTPGQKTPRSEQR